MREVRATGAAPACLLGSMVVAGLLIPLVHQPMVWVMHRAGLAPWEAFDGTGVPPFGIPALVNAMWWGALWGPVIVWLGLRRSGASWRHSLVAACTAVLTMVVGAVLVRLGRGVAVPEDQRITAVAAGLAINFVWAGATSLCLGRLTRCVWR